MATARSSLAARAARHSITWLSHDTPLIRQRQFRGRMPAGIAGRWLYHMASAVGRSFGFGVLYLRLSQRVSHIAVTRRRSHRATRLQNVVHDLVGGLCIERLGELGKGAGGCLAGGA